MGSHCDVFQRRQTRGHVIRTGHGHDHHIRIPREPVLELLDLWPIDHAIQRYFSFDT